MKNIYNCIFNNIFFPESMNSSLFINNYGNNLVIGDYILDMTEKFIKMNTKVVKGAYFNVFTM